MKFFIFTITLMISLKVSTAIDDLDLDALISNTFQTGSTSVTITSTPTPTTEQSSPVPEKGDGDCECVPYYKCSVNKTVIENGEGLIDIRFKKYCDSYLEACCEAGYITEEPITPSPPPIKPNYNVCGVRNTEGVSSLRITGASQNEAQFGEFPWMVALTSLQEVKGSSTPVRVYQCGGSLISSSVVLTAAHCVANKTGLSVRAGEWDTQTNNEPLPMQISAVRSVVMHEKYNPQSLHNNIALLLLEKPIDLDQHIRPICLPIQGETMDGRECVASGWGKDVFGKEGRYQVILKKIEKPIVPRDPCVEALRKTRLGHRFKLHESFICAGGIKGMDTCQGDGGSPLVCPSTTDPQVYVQAGIVAWGIGCGSDVPSVYVNVGLFSNWIENKLSEYNIDPKLDDWLNCFQEIQEFKLHTSFKDKPEQEK